MNLCQEERKELNMERGVELTYCHTSVDQLICFYDLIKVIHYTVNAAGRRWNRRKCICICRRSHAKGKEVCGIKSKHIALSSEYFN